MKDKGMSANEWATKAGTSPTNITRFLNSDTKYIPSSRTISKLSKVVGTQPGYFQQTQGSTIPVKDASGAVVDMIIDPKVGKVEAYQLGAWTGYGAGGIRSYSTVVVATDQKIENGDVVAVEDEEHGILVGQAMDKFIVFKASDWEFTKSPLEIKKVKLVGKVIQAITKFNQNKQD